MQIPIKISLFTLMLMISFASVNAVLFTPALPAIADFFHISAKTAQFTVTFFLIGYTLGQLLYSPMANRFGRKPALYVGIILQIISCVICILSGKYQHYSWLVIGRFLLALGSGVGLKMAFTLINECYDAITASQKISYLMIAFAITPGLAVSLGGVLNDTFGWISCFYAEIIYGFIVLYLASHLPETRTKLDYNALKISQLIHNYSNQFKNIPLISGGFIMGCTTSFIYAFAAVAPFLVIQIFDVSSSIYGTYNLMPPLGLILGSLFSARLIKYKSLLAVIQLGIIIATVGAAIMLVALILPLPIIFTLFSSMMTINFGLSLILANASTFAMSHAHDKAHGAAVMNFINMGIATIIVIALGFFSISKFMLPLLFIILCICMLFVLHLIIELEQK